MDVALNILRYSLDIEDMFIVMVTCVCVCICVCACVCMCVCVVCVCVYVCRKGRELVSYVAYVHTECHCQRLQQCFTGKVR